MTPRMVRIDGVKTPMNVPSFSLGPPPMSLRQRLTRWLGLADSPMARLPPCFREAGGYTGATPLRRLRASSSARATALRKSLRWGSKVPGGDDPHRSRLMS